MPAILLAIGKFFPGLFGVRIGEKAARIAGIVSLAIALVLVLSVGKCAYDSSVINQHETKREIEAAGAREDAADRRLEDQFKNSQSEKELHDVINASPGGALSPAAKSLACERLRRVGRVPPACGPQGGN